MEHFIALCHCQTKNQVIKSPCRPILFDQKLPYSTAPCSLESEPLHRTTLIKARRLKFQSKSLPRQYCLKLSSAQNIMTPFEQCKLGVYAPHVVMDKAVLCLPSLSSHSTITASSSSASPYRPDAMSRVLSEINSTPFFPLIQPEAQGHWYCVTSQLLCIQHFRSCL